MKNSRELSFINVKIPEEVPFLLLSHDKTTLGWLYLSNNKVAHKTYTVLPLVIRRGKKDYQYKTDREFRAEGNFKMRYLVCFSLVGLISIPLTVPTLSYFHRISERVRHNKEPLYNYFLTVTGKNIANDLVFYFDWFSTTSQETRDFCKKFITDNFQHWSEKEVGGSGEQVVLFQG